MSVDVSERAFEDAIEAALLRREGMVAEERYSYVDMPSGGYSKHGSEDYDKTLCLIKRDVLDFVLATQTREWKRLSEHHGTMVEERFLKRLASEIGRRGALDVLRNGIRDMGCKFQLAILPPGERVERGDQASARRQPLFGRPAASLQREEQQEPRPRALPKRYPHLHR